jgi:hypothetical protein
MMFRHRLTITGEPQGQASRFPLSGPETQFGEVGEVFGLVPAKSLFLGSKHPPGRQRVPKMTFPAISLILLPTSPK